MRIGAGSPLHFLQALNLVVALSTACWGGPLFARRPYDPEEILNQDKARTNLGTLPLLQTRSKGPADRMNLFAVSRGLGQQSSESKSYPITIFGHGVEALRSGQLATAEEDFKRVISLDPSSSAAHVNLGVVYMREKRWNYALAELRNGELISPNEAGIKLNIGLAFYRENDFSSAIGPLSEALRLAPESVQARYLLGLCHFFLREYTLAANTLEPLWERESTKLSYLYVLSIAAHKSINAGLERRAFDQMLAVGRGSPEFHLYAGKALLAEGKLDQASKEFQAAIAGDPSMPMAHYFLGRTYLERREYSLAETEFKQDIALEPDLPYNYVDLGRLYVEFNQISKAEQNYRHAIQLDGAQADSYVGLAQLYRDSGRWKESLTMLDSAVNLAPGSSSVHYMRGIVLAHLGDKEGAHSEFSKASNILEKSHEPQRNDLVGDEIGDAQRAVPE